MKNPKVKKISVEYKSTGTVLGNFWDGGVGGYKARTVIAPTLEALLKRAKEMLEEGSLDAGMGFERLIGAKINVTRIETIEVDGKEFINEDTQEHFIGKMTEDQIDFLMFECE